MMSKLYEKYNHQQYVHSCETVRSNTRKVHSSVTLSAAWQLNHKLHPHEGI